MVVCVAPGEVATNGVIAPRNSVRFCRIPPRNFRGNFPVPYILELTRADDPDHETTWCPAIESELPILIPTVGDAIEISDDLRLIVVKRLFTFRSERHQCVELVCQSHGEQRP